jgi:hypothetical protein
LAEHQIAVPIVFAHGDSDAAGILQTAIWRFESNSYPQDGLLAINFTDPQARDDDTVAQAGPTARTDRVHRRRQSPDPRGKSRDRGPVAQRLFDARLRRS